MKKIYGHMSLCILILTLMTLASPAHAGADLNIFGGLSGTSTVIFLFDSAADADGKVVEEASQSGLISGEGGLALSIYSSSIGLRCEGLVGRYRYKAFDEPSPSYSIFLAGAEPFFIIETFRIGAGGGVFKGNMKYNDPNKKPNRNIPHTGWSSWADVSFFYESVEFSALVRYTRFRKLDGVKNTDADFKQDTSAVIRAGLRLELF